jgi:hypothetical protein
LLHRQRPGVYEAITGAADRQEGHAVEAGARRLRPGLPHEDGADGGYGWWFGNGLVRDRRLGCDSNWRCPCCP